MSDDEAPAGLTIGTRGDPLDAAALTVLARLVTACDLGAVLIGDGLATAEFLVNIFVPKTPLHDGAVIIRGDRVAAAACLLPLSENPHLSTDLGTRHRAGIGITEHSDAVAIIISEETGTISLAVEGGLYRHLDESDLSKRLSQLLSNRPGHSLASLLLRR